MVFRPAGWADVAAGPGMAPGYPGVLANSVEASGLEFVWSTVHLSRAHAFRISAVLLDSRNRQESRLAETIRSGGEAMSEQFEFKLIGAEANSGEIDSTSLINLLSGLEDVASAIGRQLTDAGRQGRLPRKTVELTRLVVSLKPGSTILEFRRASNPNALSFDSADELTFDDRFEEVLEAITKNELPPWSDGLVVKSSRSLVGALRSVAPKIEFKVGGRTRAVVDTNSLTPTGWAASEDTLGVDAVKFTGILFAVNLKTHRLQLRDDEGNEVSLPNVRNDSALVRYLNSKVTAKGLAEFGADGSVTRIVDAIVEPAQSVDDIVGTVPIATARALVEQNPMPEFGGLELTDAEAEAFFDAIGS